MDIDKLLPALMKFQAECPPIPKDKENPYFKNKETGKKAMYADLQSIVEATRKPLSDNGLSVLQLVNKSSLMTTLHHTSGQQLESEMDLLNDKNNMQGLGSAITYARRYAMSTILGIVTEDDDDGNAASVKNATQAPPAQKNTTPNTTTPPTTKTPPKTAPASPLMATQGQRDQMWKKAETMGWTTKDLADSILAQYGCKSPGLTMAQGKEYLEWLDTQKDAAKIAAADADFGALGTEVKEEGK